MPFDGATYERAKDQRRLTTQLRRVLRFMRDGRYHTLRRISEALDYPEASVSARLRDLRKVKFGSWIVERKRNEGRATFLYRLASPAPKPVQRTLFQLPEDPVY